jgi:phage-related protein
MAETPTMEVRARLTAETAQFTSGMQKASASVDQFAQKSASLRGAMVGIGVASAGVLTTLIALGTKSFMAAARVDELDVAMNAVGKATGLGYQAIRDAAIATKDMGIEMEIAQQSAIKFAQNNLDLAYASQLARAAQDLAVVSGKNSTETFNMLTHAVITGRSEVLKSVGIQKSAGQMYESYAKSIGKSANALTYQEKQQAVATGALAEAAKVAGTYEAAMQSPGKVLRSFARITNDIQVSLGDMLLKGIGPIVFSLYEFYKSISKAITGSVAFRTVIEAVKQVIIKLTAPIVTFLEKMKDIVDNFTKVSTAAGEVKSNFDPVGDSVKKLAGAIEFLLPAIAAMMAMFATFAGAAIFANVPILGAVLGGLAGPIGIITVGLVTLYLTSSQVRTAVNNLAVSMRPFLDIIVKVGKALAVAGGFAVAIFAKAIGGLAIVVNSVTGFLKTHTTVAKILTGVILALVGGFIAYKAALIVIPAIQALVAFTSQAIGVASVLMAGGQLASIASTNGLAASMLKLNASMSANPIGLIVAAIVGLLIAFAYAWKTSEKFREVMTNVFNTVAKVVGMVIGFVMRTLGNLLLGYAALMDTSNTFARVVAAVYEFILDAVLFAIISLLKWYKWWLDAFVSLMKEHKNIADGISAVFEFIARVIGAVITAVLTYYANMIKGVATIIYFMGKLKDFIGEVWGKIVAAIGKATEFIGSIFSKLGGMISGVISFMREKFAGFLDWFIEKARMIPAALGGGAIVSGLVALQSAIRGTKETVEEYNASAEKTSVAKSIVDGQNSINDAITKTSKVVIEASKGWGNYEGGIAGTLSNVANKLLDFADKTVQFTSKVDGSKILGSLISGAEKASSVLGTTITALENFKAKDVYKTLMDTASDGATKAGNWLIATAATIESFTNSNFVEKVGESIGDLLAKLKTGLGFGDILAETAAGYNPPGVVDDNAAADALQRSADRMKSIREAMQAGIDSIKGVLDDLRNAAADFANSLKDTIVGFAGLKGVELPDGFIPKAKSLIENMNQRLNKSMQFAAQIQQLQSMNLDAGALKDIIEAGPVKGAQIAASILGGGQAAVNEISSLQKAIEYSGAAIGQMGSDAAYGGLIKNAQSKYDSLSEAQLATTSRGGTVNIAQGAFQVSIDTGGMNDEEQLKAITDKIQETFAILAKELAAK